MAEYYDFVLVGKTGQGKSTLGNKLLQLERVRHEKALCRFTSACVGLLRDSTQPYTSGQTRFATTDDVSPDNTEIRAHSVTNMCELLANDEIKVRILDVPGFSDSGILQKTIGKRVTVFDGNVQIVRWMVRAQAVANLHVRRMVYFLPQRGVLERADGTMQEELQVLHHFFGETIFNCMVAVASNHRWYQEMKYNDKMLQATTTVFHSALKKATKNDQIGCPPIVYIGTDDGGVEVTEKLQDAPVLKDEPLQLKFRKDVCSRCSVTIRKLGEEKIDVVDTTGTLIEYKQSKCHPCFVQKYTTWEKFWGGVGHTLTLGTVAIAGAMKGSTIWPGFTNSDEKCPVCENSPGSPGCRDVGTSIPCKWNPKQGTITVEHTNEI